ncbi:MAG TPA: hypothetical protein VHC72_09040, partial [Bryobacteraceae bacterium]|nr:hypothetical protein [Bryobacteraceae bacterium]
MEKDSAAYRPLLSAWFAVDYHLGGANAFAFQLENFVWFTAELLALFLLLRLIPGVNNAGAGFAVMVFGLHPVNAATVNYALRRGVIMGAFGVTAGMLIWLIWPRRLPPAIPLRLKRIPQDAFDEYLRKNFKRLDTLYRKVIHAPAGLYLWPVIPALLCDPSAAVFAPVLVAWILLFEEDRRPGRAIPAAVVCGGYWIFQAVLTRTLGEFSDTPAASYRFTQPWVALRDLYRFFVPLHLSAESDFRAFAHFWDPLAIAGYLGVACLAALAVFLGRRRQWKAVSFGIFWFLIALVPDAITAHRAVEADWRMFLPFAGLAIGVAGLASNAVRLLTRQGQPAEDGVALHLPLSIAGGCVALALLALLGWGTFGRNAAWETESTLWRAAIASSPRSGRALMRYGLTELASPDPLPGLNHLREAAQVSPRDPVVGTSLARAYERLGTPAEAESQYR